MQQGLHGMAEVAGPGQRGSAGKRLSQHGALPLPVAPGQHAGFLMWILHPPLIGGLWIVWSHFLYTLRNPNRSCCGFVWTQVPFSGTSTPVVSCLPSSLLPTPVEAQPSHPPKPHSAGLLDVEDSKHHLCQSHHLTPWKETQ